MRNIQEWWDNLDKNNRFGVLINTGVLQSKIKDTDHIVITMTRPWDDLSSLLQSNLSRYYGKTQTNKENK